MPQRPFIKTLRAQWLGQQLRRLREECGMTLKVVSQHLHRDMTALSRYERGEWPIRKGDVQALLDLYGFHKAIPRAQMLSLAEEVWRTDRWDEDYGDIVDATFIDYKWLESRAVEIKSYNPMLLPGLLQTPEYAETVIRDVEVDDVPDTTVKRFLEFRMERQQVLNADRPPRISPVIDESALRRVIGGSTVMRSQLHHLLELAKRPTIEPRVLPSGLPAHPGMHGAFIVFVMPSPYPAVAYIESLGGQLFLESPKSDRLVRAYDALRRTALDPVESTKLIAAIAKELS